MTNDLIGQWLGKYCILGWNWAKRGAAKQVWFVPNTVRQSGLVATPEKFCNFSPLLSLETVVPALKLTQNCYVNMNISFSWKIAI